MPPSERRLRWLAAPCIVAVVVARSTMGCDEGSGSFFAPVDTGPTTSTTTGSDGGMGGHAGAPDAGGGGQGAHGGQGETGGGGSEAGGGGAPPPVCALVAHVGDSLTYYAEPSLTDAYATVGVSAQIDAGGGRAILQKLPEDTATGEQAATALRESGFSGCWVVALGTNDTANVAAGAWYTRAEAIDAMMSAIDPSAGAPVMWVNTFTERSSGYWSNDNMVLWNDALEDAKARWSNMVVYDWAAVAETGAAPYVDGIHHTTEGYDVRNAFIAEAFAAALLGR